MTPTRRRPKRYHSKCTSNHTKSKRCTSPSSIHALLAATLLLDLPQIQSFSSPTPNHHLTGEHLVQTQLSHYKTSNLFKVYELCSPWFQDVTGDLNDFEQAINKPPYNLLLGHEHADILLETLPDTPQKREGGIMASCYLVCIKPGKHAKSQYPVWFWWEVSKHILNEDESLDGDGEWRVDCVMPDFEDLDFEAENLAEYLGDEEEDEDFDGFTFYMDFGDEGD